MDSTPVEYDGFQQVLQKPIGIHLRAKPFCILDENAKQTVQSFSLQQHQLRIFQQYFSCIQLRVVNSTISRTELCTTLQNPRRCKSKVCIFRAETFMFSDNIDNYRTLFPKTNRGRPTRKFQNITKNYLTNMYKVRVYYLNILEIFF